MKAIIVRGLPGSGKNRYIEDVLSRKLRPGFVVCSADDFFTEPSGEYKFDPSKIALAHNIALRKFVASLVAGNDTVLNNTNSEHWEFVNYIAIAEALKAKVEVHEMHCPDRLTFWKFFQRNIHKVPLPVAAVMYVRWEAFSEAILVQPRGV